MKLYSLKNGVNPRRVRIFLAEKKVTVPIEEFDMESAGHKQATFLAKNPLGTLPVLELDDGTLISESVAICRYFEEMIPEPPLFGRSSLERARVEMWNRRMELELLLPTIDVFVHTNPFWSGRRTQVAAWGEQRHKLLVERMRWLDSELEGRAFIGIDHYNIADITAQVAILTARGALKLAIPEDHANLTRWWNAVSARPTSRA
ncbi:glutathione S-transferase family protein [uncultured Reyranella sp.]|uniref:glutathione S-transferase family protein n=1 Tax=uncultured Reyranella sp. TaxID=735512 RepID=UPI00259D290B|nr:glutathione S-transferase family protein [uncultured Reyranella sp.]